MFTICGSYFSSKISPVLDVLTAVPAVILFEHVDCRAGIMQCHAVFVAKNNL